MRNIQEPIRKRLREEQSKNTEESERTQTRIFEAWLRQVEEDENTIWLTPFGTVLDYRGFTLKKGTDYIIVGDDEDRYKYRHGSPDSYLQPFDVEQCFPRPSEQYKYFRRGCWSKTPFPEEYSPPMPQNFTIMPALKYMPQGYVETEDGVKLRHSIAVTKSETGLGINRIGPKTMDENESSAAAYDFWGMPNFPSHYIKG